MEQTKCEQDKQSVQCSPSSIHPFLGNWSDQRQQIRPPQLVILGSMAQLSSVHTISQHCLLNYAGMCRGERPPLNWMAACHLSIHWSSFQLVPSWWWLSLSAQLDSVLMSCQCWTIRSKGTHWEPLNHCWPLHPNRKSVLGTANTVRRLAAAVVDDFVLSLGNCVEWPFIGAGQTVFPLSALNRPICGGCFICE